MEKFHAKCLDELVIDDEAYFKPQAIGFVPIPRQLFLCCLTDLPGGYIVRKEDDIAILW
jgi:hypothetical protein